MANDIGIRIKKQRDKLGYSQAKLAKICGWPTASRLGNYELETRKLSVEDAEVLAKALNVTPAFLMFGEEGTIVLNQFSYPVFRADVILKYAIRELLTQDTLVKLPSAVQASDQAFWFEVTGHSMTAPLGMRPSFPEGIMVLCDPKIIPSPSDFCLVRLLQENEVAFKKFTKEDGKSWLEPLNTSTRYQLIPLNDTVEIIGKIVFAAWPDALFA